MQLLLKAKTGTQTLKADFKIYIQFCDTVIVNDKARDLKIRK